MDLRRLKNTPDLPNGACTYHSRPSLEIPDDDFSIIGRQNTRKEASEGIYNPMVWQHLSLHLLLPSHRSLLIIIEGQCCRAHVKVRPQRHSHLDGTYLECARDEPQFRSRVRAELVVDLLVPPSLPFTPF